MGAKDSNREAIVDAAAGLFLQKGISDVSMNDIADLAGCTRRTLYRHFATREDLIFAAVTDLLEDWNSEQTQAFSVLQGTGHARLGSFLYALAERLEQQKPFLRLMGEFDFLFRDSFGFHPDRASAQRFFQAAKITETLMENLVVLGISDGSIAGDTDTRTLIPTISTVLWGTAQRVAIRDRMISEEFGLDGAQMIRTQIELYLRALTARL